MEERISDADEFGHVNEVKKLKRILSVNDRNRIIKSIRKEARPDTYYYVMVVLSCSVATYGLLSNSTAVIIGAMLIAPLMNPILGSALALINGNNKLLRVTMKAEFIGASIAIILSALLTLLLPVSDLTPEILARTEPTLIDLIIALASGAAGTYAICYRSGATLPGVAIATALMPPLCVVGITIAKQEFQYAAGALLLFLANMVAIIVIGIIIFKIAGFTNPTLSNYLNISVNEERKTLFSKLVTNNIIYPFTLLVLICIPLIIFMANSIEADRTEKTIRNALEEGLTVLSPESKIVSVEFSKEENEYTINTELNTERVIYPEDIRKLENSLEYKLASPVKLEADVTLVQKVSNESSTNAFQSLFPEPEEKIVEVIETGTPEEVIEQVVSEKLLLFEDTALEDFMFQYQRGTGAYLVELTIDGGSILDDQFKKTIESVLESKLKRKVMVVLRYNEPVIDEEQEVEESVKEDPEVKEEETEESVSEDQTNDAS
ncbi:TIGR00341 family protein [Cytobacillus sp. IB215665]|uniref:TIGR00341 family protein n=1 Tax=Cytobacillus sp. IB215665 TaxID=3097357 RepID=UPI002A107533|nr:TIGR00341 family protein [Cytobacillus sp. IB215665]MDX8365997.1 TIGR00341 family protein [Cytobacillus sp. IB215665]